MYQLLASRYQLTVFGKVLLLCSLHSWRRWYLAPWTLRFAAVPSTVTLDALGSLASREHFTLQQYFITSARNTFSKGGQMCRSSFSLPRSFHQDPSFFSGYAVQEHNHSSCKAEDRRLLLKQYLLPADHPAAHLLLGFGAAAVRRLASTATLLFL